MPPSNHPRIFDGLAVLFPVKAGLPMSAVGCPQDPTIETTPDTHLCGSASKTAPDPGQPIVPEPAR